MNAVAEQAERTIVRLTAALAKAQAAFGQISRSKNVRVRMKSGGEYRFSYAPLEEILGAVIPALSKNGLCIYQTIVPREKGEAVQTVLAHESGETITNCVPIFVSDQGAQAYGSGITYARRYGVTLILCVCADDDDDGNEADGNEREPMHRAQPLEKESGKVQMYVTEFIKCAALNDAAGATQLWDELKVDQESASTVWARMKTGSYNEFKWLNEVLKTKGEQA